MRQQPQPLDLDKLRENPLAAISLGLAWLGERPWGLPGLPLALGLAWIGLGPRLLRRRGAPGRGRALAAAGRQALIAAAGDAALMAGLPALQLSYAPIRAATFDLFVGRAGLALAGAALALGWDRRRADLPARTRRALTVGSLAAHALMTAGIVYATYWEANHIVTRRTRLRFAGRTAGAPPLRLRLAHLSDIHIERLTRRDREVVARVAAARPDLILITGDYLNNDYDDSRAFADLRRLLTALVALQPAQGVFAVIGNNDPPEATRRVLREAGVYLLDDRAVTLRIGGRRVQILGARTGQDADWTADQAGLDEAAAQAERQTPPDLRLLLYHTPDLAPQAAADGVDLYLCGHTHGGQVRLPGVGALLTGSRFGQRYAQGLNTLPNGGYIFTTSGTGFEGLHLPRFRVFCPPEVALLDLTIG